MKFKKLEDQKVDASVLLRRKNELFTGGNTETKCGVQTEGKAIQILIQAESISYIFSNLRHYY